MNQIDGHPTRRAYSGSSVVTDESMKKRSAKGRGRSVRSSTVPSIAQIRAGLPVSALNKLAAELEVDRAVLARILGVSVRSLQRKVERASRLSAAASDRLARVTRIRDLALHVLGEREKAAHWLTSRSTALNHEVPLRLLDTDAGTERVQQELREIEFGFPI